MCFVTDLQELQLCHLVRIFFVLVAVAGSTVRPVARPSTVCKKAGLRDLRRTIRAQATSVASKSAAPTTTSNNGAGTKVMIIGELSLPMR